jgi:hypothetical protein
VDDSLMALQAALALRAQTDLIMGIGN